MDCRSLWRRTLVLAVWLGLGPSLAFASGSSGSSSSIPGDAEVLLNPATDPQVLVLTNKPDKYGISSPDHVAQPDGVISGWNIKDIRLRYLKDSDTMIVGVNSFGIIGDVDGNGSPSVASPATLTAGGVKYAHLGGRESVTVAFDTNKDGVPDVVAGVPAQLPNPLDPNSKTSVPGSGIDGFLVSKFKGGPIQYAYGDRLADNQGSLVADPSAQNPDFIFTIKNWSKLPGLKDPYSFGLQMYAGSPDDVVAGEDSFMASRVQLPGGVVPEPATCLLWGLAATVLAMRARRLRKAVQGQTHA